MSKLFVDTIEGNTGNTIAISDSVSTLKTGTIQSAGGTAAMTINSSGYISQPNRPRFRAKITYSGSISYTNTLIFNTVDFNVGNGYNSSTGKFTAPIAGTYYFMHASLGSSGASAGVHSTPNSFDLRFLKNDADNVRHYYQYYGNPSAGGTLTYYANPYLDVLIDLAANDTMAINYGDGNDSAYVDSSGLYAPFFQGWLVV